MASQDPDPARPGSERSPEAQAPAGPADDRAVDRARSEQEQRVRRARQARVAKLLIVLALLVIVIIFVIGNSQGVEVDFVFVTRHPSLIWVMLASAFLGGLVGYVVGRPGKEFRRLRERRGRDEKNR
jgi:uncharacterized integral membrane protein